MGREAFKRLSVLMFTGFVDMLGSSIVFTQLPFYAQRFGARPFVVGLLISSFFLAQLITAPYWGRFSDRSGRRPAILGGLVLSSLAFGFFALASTDTALQLLGPTGALSLLLLMRLAQGAGAGTVSVVQAYVSDSSAPEDRAKALGWVTAAITTGVLIGPKLGSLAFSHLGAIGPGLLAAAVCLLNLFSAWRSLPEPARKAQTQEEMAKPRFSIRRASLDVLRHPNTQVAILTWTYTLGMLVFFSLNGVIGLYLKDKFQFDESSIGNFFLYIGVIGLVSRALLIGISVKALGEVGTLRIGTLAIAAGLLTLPLANSLGALALTAVFMPLGTALLFPATTSLVSKRYGPHDTGSALGVQQAFGGTARLIGPLWATLAYEHGQTLPFWIAGSVMVLVCLYALKVRGADPVVSPLPEAEPSGAVESPGSTV